MKWGEAGFVLNDSGRRLMVGDLLPEQQGNLKPRSGSFDDALRAHGFVFVQPFDRAILVAFCPSRVAPLAALEAVFEIKAIRAEYVVLAFLGDVGGAPKYELFPSSEQALRKLKGLACAARKRAAAKLWRACSAELDDDRVAASGPIEHAGTDN